MNVHGIGTNIHGCQPKLEMAIYVSKIHHYRWDCFCLLFFKTSILAATYYIEIVDKLIFFSLFLVFSFSSDNLHIFEDELQQGATSIAVVNESGKVPSKTKKTHCLGMIYYIQ